MIILRQHEFSKLGQRINQATRDITAARIRKTRSLMQTGTSMGKPAIGGGLKESYKKATGELQREAKVTGIINPNAKRNPEVANKSTVGAVRDLFGTLAGQRKKFGSPKDGGAGGSASDVTHVWNGKYKS